ncbi:MAG: hypothetical protein AAGG51_15245 [Cyanobacteria bacterium P01_G01_bin.54]
MLTFTEYIDSFLEVGNPRYELGLYLGQCKESWDDLSKDNFRSSLDKFIECYGFLGQKETKERFEISQNRARNLVGSMMQDWLIALCKKASINYPKVLIFTEVRVPFGKYPLWEGGTVEFGVPSEKSDIALGYLLRGGKIFDALSSDFDLPIKKLEKGESVLPVITINSKIRVSQGEFFDWLGRETLMTKGNPHCFSIQVCLRKEMDLKIVEVAQAEDKWFLLGSGTEKNVIPNYGETERLYNSVCSHLEKRLGQNPTPY